MCVLRGSDEEKHIGSPSNLQNLQLHGVAVSGARRVLAVTCDSIGMKLGPGLTSMAVNRHPG